MNTNNEIWECRNVEWLEISIYGLKLRFHSPVALQLMKNGAERMIKSSKPQCLAPGDHELGHMPPRLPWQVPSHRIRAVAASPPHRPVATRRLWRAGCGAALPPPSRALLRAGRRPAVPRLPPQVRPPRQPARPHQALRVLRCCGARAA